MPDNTITALDTATTDELIAALRARLRATLGQSCGHLEDLDTLWAAVDAIGKALAMRLVDELHRETTAYLAEHPAFATADQERLVQFFDRLLMQDRVSARKPPAPPSFGFPPFRA